MDVYCFQTDTVWEDPKANCDHIAAMVEEEASVSRIEGALLIFPELSTCGFSMDLNRVGEAADGISTQFFSRLARQHQSSVIAGLAGVDRDSERGLNEAVCFDSDGSEIARYRKVHPFSPAGETECYLAGEAPVIVEMNGWKVAPFICYDLRFPELFRLAAKDGAEIFPVIANWPTPRVEHWTTLLKARAIENQAYVFGVNRSGKDPNFKYPGASLIVDPKGEILAQAGAEEVCISGKAERGEIDEWRAAFPALSDMKLV